MRRLNASSRRVVVRKSMPPSRTAPGRLPGTKLPAHKSMPRASAPPQRCPAQGLVERYAAEHLQLLDDRQRFVRRQAVGPQSDSDPCAPQGLDRRPGSLDIVVRPGTQHPAQPVAEPLGERLDLLLRGERAVHQQQRPVRRHRVENPPCGRAVSGEIDRYALAEVALVQRSPGPIQLRFGAAFP